MALNNLFDTSKDIIDELANYGKNLPDNIFSQALREFKMEDKEEGIMDLMDNSEKYLFERHETGWYVSSIKQL